MPIEIRLDETFTTLLKNNLANRYKYNRRPDDLVVHVSDILPATCLRRQMYSRKFPELDPLTNESVHQFVRGSASEHIITQLAGICAAQVKNDSDIGIQGHPDIFVTNDNDNDNDDGNDLEKKSSINRSRVRSLL
jgi:hypothetical protein